VADQHRAKAVQHKVVMCSVLFANVLQNEEEDEGGRIVVVAVRMEVEVEVEMSETMELGGSGQEDELGWMGSVMQWMDGSLGRVEKCVGGRGWIGRWFERA
jgi:hypothetical protein